MTYNVFGGTFNLAQLQLLHVACNVVCVLGTTTSRAEIAEQIEMLFEV